MRFDDLNLHPKLLANVAAEGYELATPIQAGAIPHVLAGRDVLGCAQTGTGKTAAFALPLIHRLVSDRNPASDPNAKPKNNHADTRARALVLAPTRELATQIADGFKTYAKGSGLRGVTIYGGVNQNPQVNTLRRGVDVVIATPGRLMDLMNQGHVDLSGIRALVLDEADRMLDMGFIHDIRKIVAQVPKERQTLLFSATLPASIMDLAHRLLTDPATVKIEAATPTVDRVQQFVHFVERSGKADLLAGLIESEGMFRTIVFTRTKHGADKLVKQLKQRGVASEAIHGNKSQNARQRALDNFRRDKVPVLVATDVAARGIDVDHVTHVVNFDLTHEPETYVHRIGRTARAGAEGVAISFCGPDEVAWLRDIERLIEQDLKTVGDVPAWTRRPGKGAPRPGQRPSSGRRQRGTPAKPQGGDPKPRKKHRKGKRSANAAQSNPAGNHGGDRANHGPNARPRKRRRKPRNA